MNHFFGENFKQQRKKQDWTQEQIAEMLPSFEVCKEYNLDRSNLLFGRELSGYLQNNIQLYGSAMKECFEYFLNTAILSEEDMEPCSIEIAKQKLELLEYILE